MAESGGRMGSFLLDVAGIVPKAFGSSECIDQALGLDGPEPLLEGLVEERVAGFGEDGSSKVVEIRGGHEVDDFVSCGKDHRLAKVTYTALDRGRASMVDAGVELCVRVVNRSACLPVDKNSR